MVRTFRAVVMRSTPVMTVMPSRALRLVLLATTVARVIGIRARALRLALLITTVVRVIGTRARALRLALLVPVLVTITLIGTGISALALCTMSLGASRVETAAVVFALGTIRALSLRAVELLSAPQATSRLPQSREIQWGGLGEEILVVHRGANMGRVVERLVPDRGPRMLECCDQRRANPVRLGHHRVQRRQEVQEAIVSKLDTGKEGALGVRHADRVEKDLVRHKECKWERRRAVEGIPHALLPIAEVTIDTGTRGVRFRIYPCLLPVHEN